jgi:hypothetical protein
MTNVGRVSSDIKYDRYKNKYAFIKLLDNNDDKVFVFHKDWSDIDNAKKEDLVIYSQLIQSDKGFQAKGVRLLTDEEKEKYKRAGKKYSLSDSVNLKCSCGGHSRFSPDYRALHYVADEILNHVSAIRGGIELGQTIKYTPGTFDDMLNDDLKATINACRCLNLDDVVGAVVGIKLAGESGLGKFRVKTKILSRMASYLDALKGEDFLRIVSRISEA